MLGFNALGRLALGQISPPWVVLAPAPGAFALAREAAPLQVQQPSSADIVSLGGVAATLQPQIVASAGSFALAGLATGFRTQHAAAFGAISLSGEIVTAAVTQGATAAAFAEIVPPAAFETFLIKAQGYAARPSLLANAALGQAGLGSGEDYLGAVPLTFSYGLSGGIAVFDPTEPLRTGFYVLTPGAVDLSYDLAGGGGVITGGTFSRQRWRDMLAAEEAGRQAALRRARDARRRKTAERCRREAALAAARERARIDARAAGAAAAAALGKLHAAAAARGVAQLREIAALASVQAAAAARAAAQERDDVEAIALLLLARNGE